MAFINDESLPAAMRTVAIGITGHRFLGQTAELIPCIDAVLDHITAHWSGATLTALSALAEGSDRLVARRILIRPHAKLVAPLPMSVEEYVQDFNSARSQEEFSELLAQADEIICFPSALTRPAAYEIAGQYIIGHCDVLIALWNGQPPHGDGGTGAVVALARAQKRPLVWISANNYMPGYVLPSPAPQGIVTFENF